ncbi:MAG: alpha/beta-hydrolase family protein [Planctomycetota bacterium]
MSPIWRMIGTSFQGYWQSFSFVGLISATLFFSVSVGPSLLPRTFLVQGLLSGIALAVGYGVGVGLVRVYLFLECPVPSDHRRRIFQWVTTAIVAIVFVLFLRQMTFWQNSIRERMGMVELESAYPVQMAFTAILFGAMLVTSARTVTSVSRYSSSQLNRFLPRRISTVLGWSIVAIGLLFLVNDVVIRSLLNAADRFFLHADGLIDDGVEQPTDRLACGGPESLISWDSIGRRGKNFITGGPTRQELQSYCDGQAMAPIRVYAGMQTGPDDELKADAALQELIRVGAFERSVLVVATPTGTGWLDPGGVDTIEYLHGGDTAIVSMQYSYLPSWITILVDPQRSIRAAQVLFDTVYDHWTLLPKDNRPRLYLQGLSLGSLGSELSADLYTIFEDPIQGAVWSGPPFPSAQWSSVTRARNEDSPSWLPEVGNGRLIRFTSQKNTLATDLPWGPMRNVYIQYASDPMVFFSPDLLYRSPDWLQDRGPDVSPYLKWYPIVTFLQIGCDLPMATSVPIGHGHNYAPAHYLDAWTAVSEPPNWTEAKTIRLKKHFESSD